MFESITNFMKGLVNRMFPIKNIKQAIGIDAAITPVMVEKIDEWYNMLKGQAEWVNNDSVYSLRIEEGIVREFADIALNEMTSKVTVDKLDNIYKYAIRDLNENLQSGLALGQMIIKPLGENKVEYVLADSFIPIEFDSRGRLLKVVFVEKKRIKDDDYYFRLEYHALDQNGLTITNRAFHSHNKIDLGNEVPLTSVSEWADLEPYINYPLMTKPDFGYYRNPIKNNIDGSFNGVSIYDSAKYKIKHADEQYGRLNWEFESGERVLHVSPTALKIEINSSGDTSYVMPKLNRRLYKALDLDMKEGELYKEYSPEFREQSILNGLEEYKRDIEFSVGLSYGDISNPSMVEKTATEVKSAKKRKYNTVTAIQENLRDCLSDLVDALAFYNALATTGYQFICDFKDSILVDEETERKEDRADMAAGILRPEEYRSKWYSETLEKALENLPQQADIIP